MQALKILNLARASQMSDGSMFGYFHFFGNIWKPGNVREFG